MSFPMERRLTREKAVDLDYEEVLEMANESIQQAESVERLFSSFSVDRKILRQRIVNALKRRKQILLPEVIEQNGGLEKGLTELFGYISVLRDFRHHIHPERTSTLSFDAASQKSIVIPEIIILK